MVLRSDALRALQETIEHWDKDICGVLGEGVAIGRARDGVLRWQDDGSVVGCYAQDASLCRMNMDPGGRVDCCGCPYYRFYGITCNDRDSHWGRFMSDPKIETFEAMIASLEEILESSLDYMKKRGMDAGA